MYMMVVERCHVCMVVTLGHKAWISNLELAKHSLTEVICQAESAVWLRRNTMSDDTTGNKYHRAGGVLRYEPQVWKIDVCVLIWSNSAKKVVGGVE